MISRDLVRRSGGDYGMQAAQQRRTDADLTIYDAEVAAYVSGEMIRIGVNLVTDASTYAASREMDMVDTLLAEAGSSRVKQQIAGSYLSAANRRNHDVLRRGLG